MAHFGEAHPLISDLLQKKHKNIIQNWKCGHEGEELSLRRALEAPEEEAMNNAQQSRRTFLNQMTAMGTAFAGTAMIPSLNSEHKHSANQATSSASADDVSSVFLA
jgi:hypothetical protein